MKSGILEVQQRGNLADSDPRLWLIAKKKAVFDAGFSINRNHGSPGPARAVAPHIAHPRRAN